MGFFSRLFGLRSKRAPVRRRGGKSVKASGYDAAETTTSTARHWQYADSYDAVRTNSLSVRKTLRERSRYEHRNSSYYFGMVETLANDIVGTAPRLQVLTGNDNFNSQVEAAFRAWAVSAQFGAKVRELEIARIVDGEAFCMLADREDLDNDVKLWLRIFECDRVTNSSFDLDSKYDDGILFDDLGLPVEYHVLKEHPGGMSVSVGAEYLTIPARSMIHHFKRFRPEQTRGVPAFTPSFNTMAMLRDYTHATLKAAQMIANIALALKVQAPDAGGYETENINESGDDELEIATPGPMDVFQLEPGMVTVLPEGTDINQPKVEQPSTTYSEFKRDLIMGIARPVGMPYNVAAGDSSKHNYASGRLDHQVYVRQIGIDRDNLKNNVLDPIFRQFWLRYANQNPGLDMTRVPAHAWFFDGFLHVDPLKEAKAQGARLSNMTTTLADEYASLGKDWEVEIRQRARELSLLKELGIEQTANAETNDSADEEDDDE